MTAWLAVASRTHGLAARAGGFCQLNHGKEAPLRRLQPGDRLVYYAPREDMRAGAVVQAFVALADVLPDTPYQVDASDGFRPFRRAVRYYDGDEAPIRPLLSKLSFTRDRASWGQIFRRGTFRIEPDDVDVIAAAMKIAVT